MIAFSAASTAQAAVVTLTASDTTGSSFNSSGKWSDGTLPSSANEYQVNGGFTLRTPNAAGIYAWAGGKLTIGNGTTAGNSFFIKAGGASTYSVSDLRLNAGSINAGSQNTTLVSTTLQGGVIIDAGGASIFTNFGTVQTGTNESLTLNSNISGTGGLAIANLQSTSVSSYTLNVNLNGTNTYDGGTKLTGNANGNYKLNVTLASNSSLGNGSLELLPGGNAGLSLTLNSASSLDDDATVTIGGTTAATASNVSMKLNFTGGEVIGSLVYNGTTYASGKYGSSAANALDPTVIALPAFTGNGYLSVVPEPATLSLAASAGAALLRRLPRARRPD